MTGRWASPVAYDRTRPVVIFHEWNLTRNDRTLGSYIRSLRSSVSGHNLNVLMTIEIGRSIFEEGATWHASHDRSDRHVRSPHVQCSEEPNGSIRGGSLFKPHGQLKLTLLAICIDIATL